VRCNPWKRKEFCSVCSGRSERTELRRLIPAARGPLLCIVAQRFIGKESKKPVMQDGTPGRGSPVVEPAGISRVTTRLRATWLIAVVTVVLREGIETGTVSLEKNTAVILVRAVLGDDLNLCAAVASVFRVVVVRDDFDFLDGVLVRRDDGCTSPGNAGGAYAVDLIVVVAGPRAVCRNLPAIFDLEDAIRSTRAADSRRRQIAGSPSRRLSSIAE